MLPIKNKGLRRELFVFLAIFVFLFSSIMTKADVVDVVYLIVTGVYFAKYLLLKKT
ncbi:MAG: hypothetical protein PHO63_04615 [Bacilli bacterium]|nr:hypothetical protein [Bacilli bacterium]MDD4809079.1 hypothetical protein [Bacilli bacterium]